MGIRIIYFSNSNILSEKLQDIFVGPLAPITRSSDIYPMSQTQGRSSYFHFSHPCAMGSLDLPLSVLPADLLVGLQSMYNVLLSTMGNVGGH